MKLSKFNYSLPKDLIAKWPSKERDECKLMVVHRDKGTIEHRLFKDIIEYFDEDDVMILNNTKVFPAKTHAVKEKTGAKIEVFLLRELNKQYKLWETLVDPARKIRIGNKLFFESGLVAEVVDNTTSGGRTLRFLHKGTYEEFRKELRDLGDTPIPKYMEREPDESDIERYQTVYSKHEGSIIAPAAGLHFSKNLLKRLEIKGINLAEITLHLGLPTFSVIEVEALPKHRMGSERVIIDVEACNIINKALDNERKVCAVGTTCIRSIESSVSTYRRLNPFDGWTNKFIYPPYDFSIANCMLTNFHMPKTALLTMVSAFAGDYPILDAYKEAIKHKYNFYSYGDCMLIL
ncbi:tRNA preQ1(34) S-adenosylmethionine ribosyltransferase-isomerase QueA [Ichthyobacterium seriolicida]|uniref:S-adenosylmethionine:tRNA ribosyltransferase-isomerase n=1 Tax=Ichthyobacterium seriolicida TaxID=242600 RepID=A0A1J1E1T9_9FLAO|nr:tRNA preQ1(34) S-adenosylmethionine ribosyltransferase-isomerase QueA [Ichthyobacterium seriolicida]BAV94917.1 S-adenosylmethionine:tRNA ribosyltransferase-isomerase [Ichthyobacterium seriolicida]